VDVATIDQEYQQLQQESQELTGAIQAFATKMQAATDVSESKDWLLDLKGIALQIQQEQMQMQMLLQALHAFAVNTIPADQPAAPVAQLQQAPPEPARGGILSHFMGGGFGQAMVQGAGMGAGFGIADSVINSIF
jgi:hypothetical protein